ncbi:caspase domain-containing protein [Fibrobacter succinogenes subsp. elongatus]|uniref:Caspase domain-containing protein n=2 Tax=Fibrobacter succinogenes TaxID=833 RepID=A0A380S6P2_FIBSU|nr:caspase domain-containing protein [Fibrobacter succinogenes subsp. elongatus]SUQ24171.1 Caspase domain-containing protein [Fibrobacter succinogenes]
MFMISNKAFGVLSGLSFAFLFVLLFLASNADAATESGRINRYVVAVSANNGGAGRPMLRYAESDARSFAKVLKEMGGVLPQNVILVKEPSVVALQKEFANLDAKILQDKASNGRDEVLVYYSGHADEKGLRLGEETYAWKDLRNRIDALSADVKIAVIDACGSGAITRVKGGKAVPAFMVDQSSDMKGYAFITSSTQDESSQESDKLKGSFFTHSLVSGLRGAGDLSSDGRVTLSEAYQFAFNETLQKTETTLGGAQHPSRDMNLAGTGDVVMTDLRATSAGLDLDESVGGRLYIRDADGELVAELNKKQGHAMSLGLPAGNYTVNLQQKTDYMGATVALVNGKREKISMGNFTSVVAEQTVFRGEIGGNRSCPGGDTIACSLDSLDHNGKFRTTFNFVDTDSDPRKGLQLGLFVARTKDYMLGTQVSLFANIAQKEMHGLQATTIVNVAKDHFEGAQLSSVANYAGSFDGAQVSSVVNIAKDKSSGAQIGIVNVAVDSLNGLQVSAGVNYARATDLQVTAGVNVAQAAKMQVVAGVNYATNSKLQIAAGVNATHVNEHLQVGVVNYATKEKGRQWGIVNICAHCEKSPVGLVNIVGNGVWSVTPYINEMGALGGSVHLGTAYFYTNIEWAAFFKKGHIFKEFEKFYEHGVGIGTQFGKYGSHWELEYTFFNVYDKFGMDEDDWKSGYHHRGRVGYVYQVVPGFGLSVGGTLNLTSEGYINKLLLKPLGDYHDDVSYKDHKGRWWPGFYAGLTIGRF